MLFPAIVLSALAHAQTVVKPQIFTLNDTKDLTLLNVNADSVQYKGRQAVRLTNSSQKDGFALLPGPPFSDGTIEADIALKITTPPGVRMPGFVGIAFRARADASHYELFYLRPGNASADDQAMRNHSVQYVEKPDFDWYALRREWPWVYESYANIHPETWMHIRIEVKGRSAKLFINDSDEPSLVVDGLKGEDLEGRVALWPYQGEEAYFANVRITPAPSIPIKNGSDVAGTWQVQMSGDAGAFKGTLQLMRDGDKVTGTWSGDLGKSQPVMGTWREGYVELSFNADWPKGGLGAPGTTTAHLAGWIDGNHASGRMKIEGRTDGKWTGILSR